MRIFNHPGAVYIAGMAYSRMINQIPASTTAMLVMGDALAMAVLQARGFTRKDFARYHPSGAIGRALRSREGEATHVEATARALASASPGEVVPRIARRS